MGHQVNFYLDGADTISLEERIRGLGPLAILHSLSPGPEPRVLDGVNFEENGRPWLFLFLVRPEDLPAVKTREVPAQGHWTIDDLRSPVVELNRCFFDGKILRRGRVYYLDGFYVGQEWQDKPDSFRKWAKAVLATTKKGLKKHESEYIGPGAAAWLASAGGKLVP